MITNLSTFEKQRDYLTSNGFSGQPFSPALLESIGANLDFNKLAKIENSIALLDPDLTHDYEAQLNHLTQLKADQLNQVSKAIEEERVRASALAMKRVKEKEKLQHYKTKILELSEALEADANKLNSTSLASLLHKLKQLGQ